MRFDPEVWGPHYWFFLHTLAHSYPAYPNEVTKRKYYDFIQNLPLFIPNEVVGNKFSRLLDKYPVSPYLDKKDSFIRWVHFIHNKVNASLGKEEYSYEEGIDAYFRHYSPEAKPFYHNWFEKQNMIYWNAALILAFIMIAYSMSE